MTLSASKVEISRDKNTTLRFFQLVMMFTDIFDSLDQANSEQTPRGIVQLISKLVDSDVQILVSPQQNYNYSVSNITQSIHNAIENTFSTLEVDGIFQGIPEIRLVRFPRIERDNILLHVILGHEIGHEVAANYLSQEQTTAEYQTRLQVTILKVNEILSADKTFITLDANEQLKLQNTTLQEVLKVRTRGLQELISDVTCAYFFGPSGLFGFYDFLTVFSNLDDLPRANSYYPPPRYRLRYLVQVLTKNDLLDELYHLEAYGVPEQIANSVIAFVEHIKTIVGDNSDLAAIKANPYMDLVYDWIEELEESIGEFVRNSIGTKLFEKGSVQEKMPESIARLCLNIPANELGKYPNMVASDWGTAILAGWIVRIALKFSEAPIPELEGLNEDLLRNLTLTALEYCTLVEKYTEEVKTT